MIDASPAKLGVDNPSSRRKEQRPFESWAELDAVAANLPPRYGPMVIFAAATGLRPAEWLALERRDVDRGARVVYVRRSFTKGRLKCTKTEASRRAAPLQQIALEAIEHQPASPHSPLLFRLSAAAIATSTTSVTATGSPHNVTPESSPYAGSTISGTPSRPSRFVPGSRPSTSLVTWVPA
jgi:integrase